MQSHTPFNPITLARQHLIEMLMVLVGRSLTRACDYRRDLESMTLDELSTELERVEKEAVLT